MFFYRPCVKRCGEVRSVLSVSFRIQAGASLLAVRPQDRSRWLLACYEHWQPTLGTRLCRHLGALRWVLVGMGAGQPPTPPWAAAVPSAERYIRRG